MSHTPVTVNLFFNGEEVKPSSGRYVERFDPGNNDRLIGVIADGSRDVGAAIDAARDAFDRDVGGWVTDYRLRARVLLKAAELIRENAERLAEMESLFSGKTIRTSRLGDVPRAAELFEFYAGAADKIIGTSQVLRTGDLVAIVKQPAGVVAAITPWNFPLVILCRQVAPALAAGCTVVAKPASLTPATAVELAKILSKAGATRGVFNVVTGSGVTVGRELVKSEKVDVLNFTGETSTGKWIMENAAGTLKRVVLELGGKNPNIVFEDADPENPLDFLIHVKKVALPLLPQLGLEPNVYYVPPIHVRNINFLRMLFGPGVEHAIQTYRKAMSGRDIELVAVLLMNVSTDRIMTKFKVIGNSEVAGYDENGHEVVRVPLKEPTIVRPFFDEKLQTYRHNIT